MRVIKKAEVRDLVSRVYSNSCLHGFHDDKLSVEHCLMLVLSEVGEAIEADRKSRRADMEGYRASFGLSDAEMFEKFIKGSVEEELADVVIRLFDLCGMVGMEPTLVYTKKDFGEFMDVFDENYKSLSFCERCFILSCIICRGEEQRPFVNGVINEDLSDVIGASLLFVMAMSRDMGIDIWSFVELKMRYNESRPKKHGKGY